MVGATLPLLHTLGHLRLRRHADSLDYPYTLVAAYENRLTLYSTHDSDTYLR